METIYKRNAYEISPQEYADGRTLICIQKFEPFDKSQITLPHEADYELRFRLCSDKYIPFFLSEAEFHKLLTDDVARIKMERAFEAEKESVKQMEKSCGIFEQKRNKTYLESLEKIITKNAEAIQKNFGGEGK